MDRMGVKRRARRRPEAAAHLGPDDCPPKTSVLPLGVSSNPGTTAAAPAKTADAPKAPARTGRRPAVRGIPAPGMRRTPYRARVVPVRAAAAADLETFARSPA